MEDDDVRRRHAAYWRWYREFLRDGMFVDQDSISDAVEEMQDLIADVQRAVRRSRIRLVTLFALATATAAAALVAGPLSPIALTAAFLSVGQFGVSEAFTARDPRLALTPRANISSLPSELLKHGRNASRSLICLACRVLVTAAWRSECPFRAPTRAGQCLSSVVQIEPSVRGDLRIGHHVEQLIVAQRCCLYLGPRACQAGPSSRRSSAASATDASISALRIDTLSTLNPNGMLSLRQNVVSSLAVARH